MTIFRKSPYPRVVGNSGHSSCRHSVHFTAFGEGGARRDVVRHAAELARAENAAPSSLSQHATIMDVDGTVHRKGTNGWTGHARQSQHTRQRPYVYERTVAQF